MSDCQALTILNIVKFIRVVIFICIFAVEFASIDILRLRN